MPDIKEPAYEDSYEKYERLKKELVVIFSEIRGFLVVLEKDFTAIGETGGTLKAMDEKMEELRVRQITLEEELKKAQEAPINPNLTLDEKIDAEAHKFEKIDACRQKITQMFEEQSDLLRQMDAVFTQETAQKGDSEGTFAIIQMKIARVDQILQEIADLEKEQ